LILGFTLLFNQLLLTLLVLDAALDQVIGVVRGVGHLVLDNLHRLRVQARSAQVLSLLALGSLFGFALGAFLHIEVLSVLNQLEEALVEVRDLSGGQLVVAVGVKASDSCSVLARLATEHPVKLKVQDGCQNSLQVLELHLMFRIGIFQSFYEADDFRAKVDIFVALLIDEAQLEHDQVSLGLANCLLISAQALNHFVEVSLKGLEIQVLRVL